MHEKFKSLIIEAQNGNEKSLETLIQLNNGLIWGIVRKFWYKDIEQEDLYQIGCIGFIKAVRRFDFSYEVQLSTYAAEYIFGEIKKFIRDDGIIKISRNIKELGNKVKEIQKDYGEELLPCEIAKILDVSEKEVNIAMDSLKKVESINQYVYEEGSCEKIEKLSNYEDNEEILIDKIYVSSLLENLKIRDKEIIKLRYFKEKTQTQVAVMMGISQVQVSRIERRVLKELRAML